MKEIIDFSTLATKLRFWSIFLTVALKTFTMTIEHLCDKNNHN